MIRRIRRKRDVAPILVAALKMIGSAAVTAIAGAVASSLKEKVLDPSFKKLQKAGEKQIRAAIKASKGDPKEAAVYMNQASETFGQLSKTVKKKDTPAAENLSNRFSKMANDLKREAVKTKSIAHDSGYSVRDSRQKRTLKRPNKRATMWEIRKTLELKDYEKIPKGAYGVVLANGDVIVRIKGDETFDKRMSGYELDRLAMIKEPKGPEKILAQESGYGNRYDPYVSAWNGPNVPYEQRKRIEEENQRKLKTAENQANSAAHSLLSAIKNVELITKGIQTTIETSKNLSYMLNNMYESYRNGKQNGFRFV